MLPSNEGRGYVLRRIMRRAMRHAELLGAKDPLMYRLVPTLVREMGQAYPELVRAEPLITETLKLEETRFRKTLERGLAILDEETAGLKHGDSLKGEVAFTLYDTYGFPLDLTQDALQAARHRRRSRRFQRGDGAPARKARASWAGSGEAATETVWFALREKVGATEFLGYETETAEGVVAALVRDGKRGRDPRQGRDRRRRAQPDAVLRRIRRPGRRHRHYDRQTACASASPTPRRRPATCSSIPAWSRKARSRPGSRSPSKSTTRRRTAIRANHSATHLLHEALRQVLGDHVAQKGSLVAPERLRFDFSHPKPMSAEEIERVEDIANDIVLQNAPVTTRLMAVDDAIASGARALFGEKYGDEVRVVAMGDDRRRRQCAGLVGRTVRRHPCAAHRRHRHRLGGGRKRGRRRRAPHRGADRPRRAQGGERHTAHRQGGGGGTSGSLEEVPERVTALLDDRKRLERELSDARRKLAMGGGARSGEDGVRQVGDIKLLARAVSGIEIKDLKSLADDGKKQVGSGVVAIVGVTDEGKAGIVVGVTPDLTARFNAVELVRRGAEALGGKGGGGRPDMAQAGGPDGGKAEAALDAIAAALGGA